MRITKKQRLDIIREEKDQNKYGKNDFDDVKLMPLSVKYKNLI